MGQPATEQSAGALRRRDGYYSKSMTQGTRRFRDGGPLSPGHLIAANG
jgi:hypothetical protein